MAKIFGSVYTETACQHKGGEKEERHADAHTHTHTHTHTNKQTQTHKHNVHRRTRKGQPDRRYTHLALDLHADPMPIQEAERH